jgi:undecaprenyl-diphosphatase
MENKFKEIKSFIKDNIKWIILFICIISILFLIEDVMDKDIANFDEQGYLFVSQNLISDTMTPIAKCITNFANALFLIGLSVFLLIAIKNKKIGKLIFINLGVSALINFTLKQILQRPRPVEHMIINESGYSLPSGHSMVSMAFYGFLIYLIYKNIKNKYLKYILIALLFVLIMSIGISRIYLGVHYPSDVIAGFLVAISYLIMFIHIVGKNCGEPR